MEVKEEPVSSRKIQKAEREKIRRDKLKDQFLELGDALGIVYVYLSQEDEQRDFSISLTNGLLQISIGLRATKLRLSLTQYKS